MERLSMRKIREILRLSFEAKLSARQIGRRLQMGRTVVGDYLKRPAASGLGWPLPAISEAELEQRLFPPAVQTPALERPRPDWSRIHQEWRRPGVTLQRLWLEHKTSYPDGLPYSAFCNHDWSWRGRVDPVMRQNHRAGERLFVD